VVALNPATYAKDVKTVRPGGYLVYDSTWPLDPISSARITILGMPVRRLCVETFERTATARCCATSPTPARSPRCSPSTWTSSSAMLKEKFGKKPKLLGRTTRAIKLGYDYAKAHFEYPLPFRLEKMDATEGQHPHRRQHRAALGAVYAGATVGAWYPITPAPP
jgi:2-oxoglutarate ferredoxin oxidoreductase subunit alpha